LARHCDDGHLEIDNLPVQRALHGVAIRHRITCSPARTPAANVPPGSTACGTAILNGIDPEAFLRHVLGRIADHPMSATNDRYFMP